MTGSVIIGVGIPAWMLDKTREYPFRAWIVILVIYLVIVVYMALRKQVLENHALSEQIRIMKTPLLSFLFDGKNKLNVQLVSDGSATYRVLRVCVHNDSLTQARKVQVKIKDCQPEAPAAYLWHPMRLMGEPRDTREVDIGAGQEAYVDILTERTDIKEDHVYFCYASHALAPVDRRAREITVVAGHGGTGAPTAATFRVRQGQDGFLEMEGPIA